MRRKYRIRETQYKELGLNCKEKYVVEMNVGWFWYPIKEFQDEDMSFAKREAEELLEVLEGEKDVKVRLL